MRMPFRRVIRIRMREHPLLPSNRINVTSLALLRIRPLRNQSLLLRDLIDLRGRLPCYLRGLYVWRLRRITWRRFIVELIEELVTLIGSDYGTANINDSSNHCADYRSWCTSSLRIRGTSYSRAGYGGVITRRVRPIERIVSDIGVNIQTRRALAVSEGDFPSAIRGLTVKEPGCARQP